MAEGPAAPNLFERIAKAGYEATRVWCEAGGGTPRAPWHEAEAWRRESAVEGVKRAVAGATPEQLHEAWRKDRIDRGWKHGEVRNAEAKEDPHLKPYAELGDSQKRKSDLFAAVAQILYRCGKERWDVKTMTDPAAGKVNIDEPQKKTIVDLIGLKAPIEPVERQPEELTTYQLKGTITMAKLEADKDVHMVLSDGAGKTMIIESVSPDCAENSRVLDQITAVRQAVTAQFPGAIAGSREGGLAVPVTVTGVAFFDRLHGQEGVALNGIELHPVLSFEVQPAAK
jgi:hypothetical protein